MIGFLVRALFLIFVLTGPKFFFSWIGHADRSYMSFFFYKSTTPPHEGSALMTSSKLIYLPKTLPPNIITLMMRASTQTCGEDNHLIHSRSKPQIKIGFRGQKRQRKLGAKSYAFANIQNSMRLAIHWILWKGECGGITPRWSLVRVW